MPWNSLPMANVLMSGIRYRRFAPVETSEHESSGKNLPNLSEIAPTGMYSKSDDRLHKAAIVPARATSAPSSLA